MPWSLGDGEHRGRAAAGVKRVRLVHAELSRLLCCEFAEDAEPYQQTTALLGACIWFCSKLRVKRSGNGWKFLSFCEREVWSFWVRPIYASFPGCSTVSVIFLPFGTRRRGRPSLCLGSALLVLVCFRAGVFSRGTAVSRHCLLCCLCAMDGLRDFSSPCGSFLHC